MSNIPSIHVELTLPKAKFRKLRTFLDSEGGKVISIGAKEASPTSEDTITRGSHQAGENPSDFAGIWKDDERDIDEIRRRAWGNRGITW